MLVLEPERCGPRQPADHTPERSPRSIRRTSSIDTQWPDGLDGRMVVRCRARDLLTTADGSVEVLDEVRLTLEVDGTSRRVDGVSSDTHPHVRPLVHELTIGSGFRDQLARRAPQLVDSASALHLVLDDLPGASLVSGYALLRAGLIGPTDPDAFGERADICAGWVGDGVMMRAIREHHTIPTPDGPEAPSLVSADDALAWHDLPTLEPVSTRRLRRIDVTVEQDSATAEVDAFFRDSHVGDRPETVLHEYSVTATVDGRTITRIDPRANVLPWIECPGAVASAQRVVGTEVSDLRPQVRASFRGASTCTHLNDTLRHLADVDALLAMLER